MCLPQAAPSENACAALGSARRLPTPCAPPHTAKIVAAYDASEVLVSQHELLEFLHLPRVPAGRVLHIVPRRTSSTGARAEGRLGPNARCLCTIIWRC